MKKNQNSFFYILLPLIMVGLLGGVYRLLVLRFEAGDVYPPYSSLRADPLGTKAFYDGLAGLKGLAVERSYRPIEKLERPREIALMDLGEDALDVMNASARLNKEWEAFALKGGRLVVVFLDQNSAPEEPKPTRTSTPRPSTTPSPTPTPSAVTKGSSVKPSKKSSQESVTLKANPGKQKYRPGSGKKQGPVGSGTPVAIPIMTHVPEKTLGEKWGFSIAFKELPKTTRDQFAHEKRTTRGVKVIREGTADVPDTLTWHTGYYFDKLDPAWKAFYRWDGRPVAIERALGKGTLVFFLDSFLVSNEGLRDDRHADLLAYFVGDKRRVVFDETHLGVYEAPNTATLIKNYGLQGFFLGLLVLALFFIWRNTSSLVPPRPALTGSETGAGSGKDFSSGLVNLLRRNIGPREILGACFEQWKKTFARGRAHLGARTREMEREMEGIKTVKNLHPVEGYARLSKILKKRKI